MNMTPEQFQEALRNAIRAEIPSDIATVRDLVEINTALAEIAHKLDTYIAKEWPVHIHGTHQRLDARIRTIERKLGIKAS
jgi:hypothetical protein